MSHATPTTQPLTGIAGLVFDVDGTLVDTLADIATGINLARRRFGLPPLAQAAVNRAIGHGSGYLVRHTLPVGEARLAEAHRAYLECYDAHILDRTRPYPGVPEVLRHFAGRPLGVVSNKPARQMRRVLEGLGLARHFVLVLGGDSAAGRKPSAAPVQRFLVHTGLRPEQVAMVGDLPADIQAGRAAGCRTVAVTYGVGSREALAAEGPDRLIDRAAQLMDVVA